MKTPENLHYAKTHEWVELLNGSTTRIGLSDFAQQALGDIVFLNLPEAGDAVTAGQTLGDVESVKAVSDILSPVTGSVTAVNQAVIDHPELINENPYGSWLVEVSITALSDDLMSATDYEAHCKEAH